MAGIFAGGLRQGTAARMSPVVFNNSVTALHGLGRTPDYFDAFLECTTAEHGYSVGDRIQLTGVRNSIWANSTTVGVSTEDNNIQLIIPRAGGDDVTINNARWDIVVTPYVVEGAANLNPYLVATATTDTTTGNITLDTGRGLATVEPGYRFYFIADETLNLPVANVTIDRVAAGTARVRTGYGTRFAVGAGVLAQGYSYVLTWDGNNYMLEPGGTGTAAFFGVGSGAGEIPQIGADNLIRHTVIADGSPGTGRYLGWNSHGQPDRMVRSASGAPRSSGLPDRGCERRRHGQRHHADHRIVADQLRRRHRLHLHA